ncbi:MAG: hydroxymyristoyl-ACP dehydratase [Tepidisphaerales bacterium]
MRFELLDKVLSADGERIVAVKRVSLAEEYLADHFPTFPVLPGVMMLEAATQACGWVMRLRTNFERPVVVLKEAKNVKYGHFVAPGQGLRVEAERVSGDEVSGSFKVVGVVERGEGLGEKAAFTARLEVVCFRPGEKSPALAHLDGPLAAHARRRWALIAPSEAANLPV